MSGVLCSIQEVVDKINAGKYLLLAGADDVLEKLPPGEWIAGTIPYFMTVEGGQQSYDKIFVNELPDIVKSVQIKSYDKHTIANVYKDGPANGFTALIIPASSQAHLNFALECPQYDAFATTPLIGWISGVKVEEIGKAIPKVVCGNPLRSSSTDALAMHVTLPDSHYADIDIINIFSQGDGDVITFPNDSFKAKNVKVNGVEKNLASYLREISADTRFPLVANYFGAMINTSFQSVDEVSGEVAFYAPVFQNVEYRLAKPVSDYVKDFQNNLPQTSVDQIFFSCNCILNYLYSELEGKKTANLTGPITFGEVAYQLVNQTFAYLTLYKR